MKKTLSFLVFAFAFSGFSHSQITKQVLFLGNSYTQVNNLPQLISDIADSFGDSLIFDSNLPGGTTFQFHSTNATSLAKIAQQPWDFVVLQEQSQRPSFSPGQVATDVFPFADSLVRSIADNSACTVPLFYMTWGRKNGDASNCASYPPVCTYLGMQGRLRESYIEMSDMFETEVTPVGAAWKQVRDSFPLIELYNPDESHPSVAGSYLAACVFYASIYKKDPIGTTYLAGLSPSDALILQTVASHTVLDSLPTWNMDTSSIAAGFTFAPTANLNEIQFTNSSQHATTFSWDFGDLNYSIATSPLHTFSAPGTYTVTLNASRKFCHTGTFADTVVILSTDRETVAPKMQFEIFPNPSGGDWKLQLTGKENPTIQISLFNAAGKLIFESDASKVIDLIPGKELPTGIYFLRISLNGECSSRTLIRK